MANPYFNASYYLANNLDVLAAGYSVETAESHYLQFGAKEALAGTNTARKPAPWFDIQYYITSNPDLLANGITVDTAFQHFTQYGINEGRSPSNGISLTTAKLSAYAVANPDLVTAFAIVDPANLTDAEADALANHYYAYGYNEPRPAKPADADVTPGGTFTLTNGIDNFNVGNGNATNGDDVYLAGTQNGALTLTAGDTIDSGAGTDTLKIYDGQENFGSVTLKNVEIIESYDNAQAINVSGNADIKEIWLNAASTNAATAAKAQVIGFGDAAGGAAAVATFTANGGSADAATIAVKDAGKTTAYTSIAVAGIENLTIKASGTNQLGTLTAVNAAKLTITGDGNVTTTLSNTAAYKTIDASAATGKLNIDASAANASAQVLAIKTGSGNDEYTTLFANLTKEDKIDLGAGADTLAFGDAVSLTTTAEAAVLGGVSNVEGLKVNGAVNFAVNGDVVEQSTFTLNSTGAFTGTNFSNADTLVVGGVGAGASTVAMKLGQNTFNLELTGSATAISDASAGLAVTGATVVNVASKGTAGVAANNVALTTDSNGTINLNGSHDLIITTAVPGGATTGLTVNGSSFTGKANITGTAQADSITGGSAADSITGGVGADILTGGAGANTFVFANGSLGVAPTASAFDTITDWAAGSGNKIDFGGTALAADAGTGTGLTVNSKGLVTAGAADLAAFVTALGNSTTATAGTSLLFSTGTDSYLFISDGVAGLGANDSFIKLAGVNSVQGLTFSGGDITAIA